MSEEIIDVNKEVDDSSDIFITEKDRFEVKIKYYMEGKNPIIKNYDDDYEDDKQSVEFSIFFKYPSQEDTEKIMSVKNISNLESATYAEFIQIENIRLMTLIREWTLKRPFSDLSSIHPKIIKAIRAFISQEIAGNGIL